MVREQGRDGGRRIGLAQAVLLCVEEEGITDPLSPTPSLSLLLTVHESFSPFYSTMVIQLCKSTQPLLPLSLLLSRLSPFPFYDRVIISS